MIAFWPCRCYVSLLLFDDDTSEKNFFLTQNCFVCRDSVLAAETQYELWNLQQHFSACTKMIRTNLSEWNSPERDFIGGNEMK